MILLFEIIADLVSEYEAVTEALTETQKSLISNPWVKRIAKAYKITNQVQKLPNTFLNQFINTLKPRQLKELNLQLSKLVKHSNFQKLYLNKLKTTKNEVGKNFFKKVLEVGTKKELDNLPDIDIITQTPSSWIANGLFLPAYKSGNEYYGTLTLSLKKGGTYDYFNVKYSTWEQMIHGPFNIASLPENIKKGSTSRAGTLFWDQYLQYYKVSTSTSKNVKRQRNIINKNLKRATTIRLQKNISTSYKRTKRQKTI